MKIFIDTTAWVALENKRDIYHQEALRFRDEITMAHYRLYTSNYVLDESYTLLLLNVGYARTTAFMDAIHRLEQARVLSIIRVSQDMGSRAEDVFRRFNRDKSWSFTDCTSRVIMEMLGITEAFAFDKHFEQMGFTRRP